MIPINLTALNESALNFSIQVDPYSKCFNSQNQMSIECINQYICPQIPQYFVNTGFGIIAAYVILSWLLWWFFNHGYKMIDYAEYNPKSGIWWFLGDFRDIDTRIFWDTFIRDKISKLLLGFVVVMVYLFWHGFY